MLKELSKELKAKLYDRVSDPFLVSFGTSFLIKNWRIFFYIFSSRETTTEKIKAIESIGTEANNFLIPLYFAIFYTFIYPWIKYFITWYYEWVFVKIKNRKTKIQSQELLNIDEGIMLKAEYDKQIEEFLPTYQAAKEDFRILAATVADIFYTKKTDDDKVQFKLCKYMSPNMLYKWVTERDNVAIPALGPNEPGIGIVMHIMSPNYCIVQTQGSFRISPDFSPAGIRPNEKIEYFLSETDAGIITSDTSAFLNREVQKVGRTQPVAGQQAIFYIEQSRFTKKS